MAFRVFERGGRRFESVEKVLDLATMVAQTFDKSGKEMPEKLRKNWHTAATDTDGEFSVPE